MAEVLQGLRARHPGEGGGLLRLPPRRQGGPVPLPRQGGQAQKPPAVQRPQMHGREVDRGRVVRMLSLLRKGQSSAHTKSSSSLTIPRS